MKLVIGGQTGWTYRIEISTDLVNWTLLRALAGSGATTEFNDPEAGQSTKFYRVETR